MSIGDTLEIRGAHDGFDGVYFEQLSLLNGASLPGKAMPCTADSPCVIQGCRAPACPTDEQPTVRGMTLRGDWVSRGGGVVARIMEATPEVDDQSRDAFDPNMIMQATGTPMTMLAYAGDSVAAPAPGEWSYDPPTHEIAVNPLGGADPAASIFVPHYTYNVRILPPTACLTLRYLTFEGTRGRGIEAGLSAGVGSVVPDLVMSHLVQRYATRHFILAHALPGAVIEDSVAEYGCRGWSFANPQSDGCFGYRLFDVPGAVVRRNVIRHLGSSGRRRLSGTPGGDGWPCSWCDPPWNDPTHTELSASGIAYQIKQTEGAALEDNVAEDLQDGGIALDVSRHVSVLRNAVTRAIRGLGMRNFTPTDGCPTTDPAEFCYNSDHLIDRNVFDTVGFGGDITACGIYVEAVAARVDGALGLAAITNNIVANSPTAGICVINRRDATPISDLSIAHNTLVAMPRGLIVRDLTQRVSIRSNLFTMVSTDALLLTTAALGGMTLDGDSVGPGTECPVRWDVPAFGDSIPDDGGICGTLADFAAANPPNEHSGPDPDAGVLETTTTNTTLATTTSTIVTTSTTSTAPSTTTSSNAPASTTSSTTTLPISISFRSLAAEDGNIVESAETSDVGGNVNANGDLQVGDNSTDAQIKSILSFDTSALPDGAMIVSATLRLQRTGLLGANPFMTLAPLRFDVQTGSFGGSAALQATDFQAGATVEQAGTLSNATVNGMQSTGILNSAGLAAISKTGRTQIRLAFALDDNDNLTADRMQFASGDNANSAAWPELVVTYTPGSTPTSSTSTTTSTSSSTSSTTSTSPSPSSSTSSTTESSTTTTSTSSSTTSTTESTTTSTSTTSTTSTSATESSTTSTSTSSTTTSTTESSTTSTSTSSSTITSTTTSSTTTSNTTTTLAMSFRSLGTEDGNVVESSETSGVGGNVNPNGDLQVGDNASDSQIKSILSFDTSALPDGATILSATVRIQRTGLLGANPFNTLAPLWMDVQTGAFGGTTALVASDFQAAATVAQAGTLSNPTANGMLSTGTLNAAGLAAISTTGRTQIRIAFALDDNDNLAIDRMQFASGDTASTTARPELLVTYLP